MATMSIAATPAELYNTVLVDTPLGLMRLLPCALSDSAAAPFFMNCITEQDLNEMNIEIIRNTLYKVPF